MQNIIMPKSKLRIGIDQCCSAVHSILIFLHQPVKNSRLIPGDFLSFSLSSYIIFKIGKVGFQVKSNTTFPVSYHSDKGGLSGDIQTFKERLVNFIT